MNEVFDKLFFHRKEATFVRFKKSMLKGEEYVLKGTALIVEGLASGVY